MVCLVMRENEPMSIQNERSTCKKGRGKRGCGTLGQGEITFKRGVNPSQNHTLESSEEEVKHNASINMTNKYI